MARPMKMAAQPGPGVTIMTSPAASTATPTVKTPIRQVVLSNRCDRTNARNRRAEARSRRRRSCAPFLRFIATALILYHKTDQFGTLGGLCATRGTPLFVLLLKGRGRFLSRMGARHGSPDHARTPRSGAISPNVRSVTRDGGDGMF